MVFFRDDNKSLLVVALLVFLTRIPFLVAGYGSEEDAWGLILVARNINLLGIYEVSRMPGHPVQEYLLSLLWDQPAWVLNLLTAIVSSAGVFCFMKTMVKLQLPNVVPCGIALSFVPVFFINSTNVMDYNWALSLVMLSFYLMVSGRYLWAGIILGVACGFRITAGAMVIPFAFWHFMTHRSFKQVFISGMLTTVTAIICFFPAFKVYGSTFFTYYEYFPYPPMLKNLYKGTVGAWGIPGTIAITFALVISFRNWLRLTPSQKKSLFPVVLLCTSTILLYTYSFLRIPQKTAFVLPVIPFLILLFALFLNKKEIILLSATMVFSCFFFGINLDDPLRGSKTSDLSIKTHIGTTPVVFDAVSGPVIADFSKRKLKMDYATSIVNNLQTSTEKTVIIAGWWQNELKYFSLNKQNPLVSYLYYADQTQLTDSIKAGNRIFFLPEQDFYNDLRFKDVFTGSLAKPF
ncbi:MAG: hypothetical protein M3Q95_05260 [Bacteroidota bacterium]|nr:hypothetical protein [Bacteroidota bacterium]